MPVSKIAFDKTTIEEAARLASLQAYAIMDTAPDERFDAIVRVARRMFGVSTALIAFIDGERQWLKSAIGLFKTGQETARDLTFCAQAIRHPGVPLQVEDARSDVRFAAMPMVSQGGVRFYTGVPLVDEAGLALGTLCLFDQAPRRLSPDELDTLCDLAKAASAILDLHRSLCTLRTREAQRRESLARNPQIPWTTDAQGHLLEVSPSLIATLAAAPANPLHGADWTRLIHPDDLPEATRRREHAVRIGEPYDIEHRMRSADGDWRWYRSYAAPKRDASGAIVLWYGSSKDITARKLGEAEILRMADHDVLTGLPNRAKFSRLFDTEIARAGAAKASFALHCLDLDHFKCVNDRLGHPGGDAVLQQLAKQLSRCLEGNDVLAHFGSDEFFIIQSEPDQPDGAARLAARLSAILSEPLHIEGHLFSVTASVGVAIYPRDGTEPDQLFRNADLALARAKASGRALWCFFDAGVDERQRLLLSLKLDLQDAINRDEFELAYQPLVSMASGQIEGFEALLRWRHPQRGWVSPAEFIPCAEDSGLIIPIGAWVLERACMDAATWPGSLRVAVNLSSVQFRDRSLLVTTAAALESSGLAADRLELEITESVLLLDDDVNLSVLRDLREMGIKIALDDFGTGYSSLSYLQRFPFDKLKIDRSLVSRVAEGDGGRAVVRAVIAMCRALQISITAEGVETQAQFDQLRIESCDQVQGYLISRPVPFADVLPLVARLNGAPHQQSTPRRAAKRARPEAAASRSALGAWR